MVKLKSAFVLEAGISGPQRLFAKLKASNQWRKMFLLSKFECLRIRNHIGILMLGVRGPEKDIQSIAVRSVRAQYFCYGTKPYDS